MEPTTDPTPGPTIEAVDKLKVWYSSKPVPLQALIHITGLAVFCGVMFLFNGGWESDKASNNQPVGAVCDRRHGTMECSSADKAREMGAANLAARPDLKSQGFRVSVEPGHNGWYTWTLVN